MKKNLILVFLFISSALFALDAPNPTSPTDGLTNAYTRQSFGWALVPNAGKYQLQADTTTLFNSPLLIEKTFSDNINQIVYGFHFNTHYYWRMRSISKESNDIVSEWSEIREFTTLVRPTLVGTNDESPTETYYPNQSFVWKNNYGCNKYVIETDTTADFSSPANRRITDTESRTNKDETFSYTVGDLYLGCFNYWRVKAYNENDSSEWSETFRFHTLNKAKAKSPDGLESAYTKQTFYWEYYKGLNYAIIEIDTVATFDSPALREVKTSGTSSSNCYQSVSELYFGKTHYWRIRTYHNRDTTNWSNTLSFKTYNWCSLSTPADSATNRYTSGKICWKYSTGINKYEVQIDTVPTFDSPVMKKVMESASDDDNAYYSYSNLYFGKWYYWRVRECHSRDTSKWSKIRCFKTYRHCNLGTNPQDSATEVSTSPYLYFEYATGVTYYQQQIDTTPRFDSPLCETKITTGSSTSSYNYHSFSDLLFGTRYYRRVRECLPNDTSDWSPVRCFTTIAKGAYSNTSGYASITKGATGQSRTPKLYYGYRSYIDSVEVQIDTTIEFNSTEFQSWRVKNAGSQTYAYITPNALRYGTVYYWRIRNIHSRDISDWTTPRYFTTTYKSPAPTLRLPEDLTITYAETSSIPITFEWDEYADATDYIWQISGSKEFETIELGRVLNLTTLSVDLPKDSTYYWRVQALTNEGLTKWSDARILSTKDSNALFTLAIPEITKPANGLTQCYTRQYFNWTSVENASRYVLQIDTAGTFDSPELIQNDYTTTENNVIYNLRYDTRYYYRIRAFSENGLDKSPWSETQYITTMGSPTLLSPNDPEVELVYYPTQTFQWKNCYGSTSYKIEVDTTQNFDSPVIKRVTYNSSLTNTDETFGKEISKLYLGKMTYWRVRAYNEKDSSDWSVSMSFKTYNNAVCTTPTDGATNRYTSLDLYWKRINGLPNVIIELDTVSTFDSDIKREIKSWAYNDEDAYTNVRNLYFGKTYYWRVRYHHELDTTKWSETKTFSTYRYCTVYSPADSATNRLTTGYVYWDWSKGVSYYQVQLDTTATFDSPMMENKIIWDPENGEHRYQYQEYMFGTNYYWRVRECHENDTSEWSKPRHFTTYYRGLQGNTPADGATEISSTPKLTIDYTNYIATYFVQIDTTERFDSELMQQHKVEATGSSSAYWQPENHLMYGTTYYWRVQDAHPKDTSDWSYVHAFTTITQLAQPEIINPSSQSTVRNDSLVTFCWNECPDAFGYIFQISNDENFDNILHQENLTETSTSAVLSPNSTLYWRVQAVNAEGKSPWSETRVIITYDITTDSQLPIESHSSKAEKRIINDRIIILRDGRKYDILGNQQ